jgi:hypothetical protein
VDRLSKGERIVAISSALLVIFSIFPLWASYSFEAFGTSESEGASAWDADAFSFLPKLAILLALAALVLVGLRAMGKDINLPTDKGTVYMALGGLAFVLLLITVIQGPKGIEDIVGLSDIDVPGFEMDFDVSRGILLFGSLVLAGGIAFGGYLLKENPSGAGEPGLATPPPPVS